MIETLRTAAGHASTGKMKADLKKSQNSVMRGVGLVAIGLFLTTFAAALILKADKSEIFGLLGSALGSALAALTAIMVIEFERRSADRRRLDAFESLLDRLDAIADSKRGDERNAHAFITALLFAARRTEAVSVELQSQVAGMAEASLHIHALFCMLQEYEAARATEGADVVRMAEFCSEKAKSVVTESRKAIQPNVR